MKYRLLVIAFVFFSCLWTVAQGKNDYNVSVHVSASRSVKYSESGPRYQRLDVTIDGKKYQLESELGMGDVLKPGDYKARLVSEKHGKGDYDVRQIYEFQFPNNWTRRYVLVGISE